MVSLLVCLNNSCHCKFAFMALEVLINKQRGDLFRGIYLKGKRSVGMKIQLFASFVNHHPTV